MIASTVPEIVAIIDLTASPSVLIIFPGTNDSVINTEPITNTR